ncbi:MAG TPA: FecR family protein [Steroidobacteraceae bacterium]|nr:FecR family protein [Steroidobacteraceae bacterium]
MTRQPADSVERLVRLAGERDLPSPGATARARAASEQAWRRMLARPAQRFARGRLVGVGVALAAGMAAAWWLTRPAIEPALPLEVGRIVALHGGATGQDRDSDWSVSTDQPVLTGTTLTTEGRLALSLGGVTSLRLDRQTRLRVDGRDHVTLLAGSLYVDSGGLNVSSALRIGTPAGEIGHIGTQFQVIVDGGATRVRVREGRVSVTSGDGAQDLATGDALEVRGAERRVMHGLPTYGEAWAWAASVGAILEIENRPLAEFLAWLAREQGWQLRYASDALQEQAAQVRLHGALDGLDATAMLERVALITGVPLQMRDGVLWVGTPR